MMRDDYDHLVMVEKASTVMLFRTGLISATEARAVAQGIAALERRTDSRPTDYAQVQALLEEAAGPDALAAHLGRSRVDLNRTVRRMSQREAALDAFDATTDLRRALLDLATRHRDALVPAYTLGVLAQPTTLGHYLSAYISALERHGRRLLGAVRTINRCPLGAAALGTSSFPLDRPMLADLLGFDAAIENSFDAAQIATLDTNTEVFGTVAGAAIGIGQFLADLERQFRQTNRWFTLGDPALTGVSTLMPQKRNPDEINRLRRETGELLGLQAAYQYKAHGMPHGMPDYAGTDASAALCRLAATLRDCAGLTAALVFDADRAEAEVLSDWVTATELASALQQAGMRLHDSHAYVSALTDMGRGRGWTIASVPFAEAGALYRDRFATAALPDLPLDAARFDEALSPSFAVRARRPLGGSQPEETARMLHGHAGRITRDRARSAARRGRLDQAAHHLDRALADIGGS